jgi:hypothetical protein
MQKPRKRKDRPAGSTPTGTLFKPTPVLEKAVIKAAIDWATGDGTADRLFQVAIQLEARYRVMATPAKLPPKKKPRELDDAMGELEGAEGSGASG